MAINDLCRPGGLADQVRIGGIRLFAIGLQGPGAQSDFGTMQRIATGEGSCGKRTDPPGSFTEVGNLDDLLFALDQIRPQPPEVVPVGICRQPESKIDKCRDSGHSFVLDSSITSVHILAQADVEKVDVYVFYPQHKPTDWKKLSGAEGHWAPTAAATSG